MVSCCWSGRMGSVAAPRRSGENRAAGAQARARLASETSGGPTHRPMSNTTAPTSHRKGMRFELIPKAKLGITLWFVAGGYDSQRSMVHFQRPVSWVLQRRTTEGDQTDDRVAYVIKYRGLIEEVNCGSKRHACFERLTSLENLLSVQAMCPSPELLAIYNSSARFRLRA